MSSVFQIEDCQVISAEVARNRILEDEVAFLRRQLEIIRNSWKLAAVHARAEAALCGIDLDEK